MKIKSSELTGSTLDWAVTKCEKFAPESLNTKTGVVYSLRYGVYRPSTDWAQGGPIIDREGISTVHQGGAHGWIASRWDYAQQDWHLHTEGPTPLIAACRCYVEFKLGPEVEVPDELVPHLVAQRSAEQEATIQNKSIDRPRG